MRLLLITVLMGLGFIAGVMYDQNVAVLPLMRERQACRAEKDVLRDAFQHMRPNKFKLRDFLLDAADRANR